MSYTPEQPHLYKKQQCILSSGRLVFNSYEDSILMFSKKSIAFSSVESFNIDSDGPMYVNTSKIYLGLKPGNKLPTEPILLGNKTVKLLEELMNGINILSTSLTKIVSLPEGSPYLDVQVAATQLNTKIYELKKEISDIKSKRNFTI